jgi:hypothetical protein
MARDDHRGLHGDFAAEVVVCRITHSLRLDRFAGQCGAMRLGGHGCDLAVLSSTLLCKASAITASRVSVLVAVTGADCKANSPTPEGVVAMAGAAASTKVDNRMEKRAVVFMVIPVKGSG